MSKAGPPSEFIPVPPEESRPLVKEAVRNFASVVVWTKNQATVLHTHLAAAHDMDERIVVWIPKEHSLESLDAALRSSAEQAYFSISLPRANILFRSKYLGDDGESLLFEFPSEVFKIQRRRDFRLPIPDGYVIKIEFRDPLVPAQRISRRVLDISAGGLSFQTPLEEEPVFRKGTPLAQMTFKLRSREIQTEAEVRHSREVKSAKSPMLKVGCAFTQIRPGDAQHIAAYVFEESRKYLSKLF